MLQFAPATQRQRDVFTASRLFIYYNERVVLGTVDDDSRAMRGDGIRSVAKQGGPREKLGARHLALAPEGRGPDRPTP